MADGPGDELSTGDSVGLCLIADTLGVPYKNHTTRLHHST